jgi:iron complex transport system ATP-binding protein
MTVAVDGACVQFGERTVLDGVRLELARGELVLLAGRNGAGKSTLLRVMLGAQPCARGSVTLRGRPLSDWEPRARARELAFVPQQPDCPFEFTGRELVAMGRYPYVDRWRGLGAADLAAVEAALAAVDAAAFAAHAVTSLSGGELRRITVARALATEAPLLLLDEPTSNLDLEHGLALAAALRRLADGGRGLLVACHDLNLLAPFAHRVVLLHEGRVHADGAPEQVLDATAFATVFGVDAVPPQGYFPRAFRSRTP